MIHDDLAMNLQILRPLTYVVSEEEDRVVEDIQAWTTNENGESDSEIFVFRSTLGLLKYEKYKQELENSSGSAATPNNNDIHKALQEIYNARSTDKRLIYVLLDVDNNLRENVGNNNQVIRRLKDIVLKCFHDQVNIKTLVIVSADLVIAPKLQRYAEVVYYDLPTEDEIKDKAGKILTDYNSTIQDKKAKIDTKVGPTSLMDLKGLTLFEIEQVVLASIKRFGKLDSHAITGYKRSILRKTHLLEIMDTDLTFQDVGGMTYLKEWLEKRAGVWSDDAIEDMIPMLKGLLMLGITGCGKSLIAKAIANEWGLPLVRFDTSKIFSSRVGESEANMMKALKIVESISPCVMLIDEIEKAFAGSQSSTFSDAGTTSRVIGSFLTWYQENTAPVFVVATSNGIQYLPPELISRFDDKFFVNIPSARERQVIWEIQLRKFGRDWQKLSLSPTELAEHSAQFTGREIEQSVKAGIYEWHYEKRQAGKNIPITNEHFLRALNRKVPVVKTMEGEITYLIQWVGWDDEKKNGVRAIYANARETDDDIDQLLKDAIDADPIDPSELSGRKRK